MSLKYLTLAVAAALSVSSSVTPTAPSSGQSYNAENSCPFQFNLDTTGTWTNMSIDLMTGDNFNMVTVVNVATGLDGTKGSGIGSWLCPEVNPYSAIYFYQFSNNGINPTWTTRFTIASAIGASTAPTNATQPGGAAVPWGTGHLVSNPNGNSSVLVTNSTSTLIASTTTPTPLPSTTASKMTTSVTSSNSTGTLTGAPTSTGSSTGTAVIPKTTSGTTGRNQMISLSAVLVAVALVMV